MPPLDPATPDLTPAQRQIAAWALREAAPWRARGLNWKQAEPAYEKLAAGVTAVFLFRINKGNVTIEPKPSHADHPRLGWFMRRASMYRQHFQDAAESWCPDLETTLCVCVDDAPAPDPVFPTFSFQKRAQEAVILLPDIDFLVDDYYENLIFRDNLPFTHKRNRAFFIGSFTGGLFTAETVKSLSIPRLAAAAHFHNDPDVEFRMPLQGQIESPAVAKMLAALPYCGGETATWWEQRENRFLISMDGNGATCSRVAIALRSNSVLMKYQSDRVLFYFGGLQPWLHYVPVNNDRHVERIIALETLMPGPFRHIAANSRAFAETFLSEDAIHRYTADLLTLYGRAIVGEEGPVIALASSHLRKSAPAAASTLLVGHIQNRGDIDGLVDEWVGDTGSTLAIEGFSITLPEDIPAEGFSYQAVLADGSLSEPGQNGEFRGTRGENEPIFGICVTAAGRFAETYDVSYEASFIDGSEIGPCAAGTVCKANTRIPLEAFRLSITDRVKSDREAAYIGQA